MKYSKKDVQKIVDEFPAERFGKVKLTYGLSTKGLDRSPTKDIVLPSSLEGQSFLDIGCAYGYFCFEAEDLGAKDIVGVETKKDRVDRANLFKDIRESKVSFILGNVLDYHEKKDYVLLLNVLHHLKEEAKTVLDHVYSITNKTLVIESPRLRALETTLPELVKKYDFSKVVIHNSPLEGPTGSRQIAICEK